MLWKHYVFRRGNELHEMWDSLYRGRDVRLLYVAGRGFDVRAQKVMRSFVDACKSTSKSMEASLVLVDFEGYELTEELRDLTDANEAELKRLFSVIGESTPLPIRFSAAGEDDISASNALRVGAQDLLRKIDGHTDIVLDVSTLPRVVYVTFMTALLEHLVKDKTCSDPLVADGVNLQLLVAEDAALDAHIQSEDPSNELILIPGFSGPLQIESEREWPLVWFPILGEGRVSQLVRVMASAIPSFAEICPVLPHPSRKPRRADDLLVEYKGPLFDTRETPPANILYVHEAHPFEAYRQLMGAMNRYRDSMEILAGCRLVVTPLGSKLITLGAGLACFEMRPQDPEAKHGVAIPYAEPRRYVASPKRLMLSQPEICSLLLTGNAYARP